MRVTARLKRVWLIEMICAFGYMIIKFCAIEGGFYLSRLADQWSNFLAFDNGSA
jgi:hypothetical protein